MYQMKPFNYYIYYRNDKLDYINEQRQASDYNENAFSTTLP